MVRPLVIMFSNYLPLAPVILSLVLVACSSRAVPTPAGVPNEPTQSGITKETPPTATPIQAPSPTPTASPPPPAGSPTTTPTQPPFGEANLTATVGSFSTQTVAVIPSPIPAGSEIPWSDWAGPGILYLQYGFRLVLSNFDGSQKSPYTPLLGLGDYLPSFSPETGRVVAESEGSLIVVDLGQQPEIILNRNEYTAQAIESPVISSDGRKIAYSQVYNYGEGDLQELWTINSDGTENTLVIDDTGQYITEGGPFRLGPVAWSSDNSQVYMLTTSDMEATPKGMYVADLATGTIEKVLTPPVTLWDVSFSPDRTRIAYQTFQWKPIQQAMPAHIPPFKLNVTDLTTGETKTLLESETEQYFHPIWSPDGKRLAYSVRPYLGLGEIVADTGIFTIDLATGGVSQLLSGSENKRLIPYLLSEDRLVFTEGYPNLYTEGDPFAGGSGTLYTINLDGTEKYAIDLEEGIVLGVVDN